MTNDMTISEMASLGGKTHKREHFVKMGLISGKNRRKRAKIKGRKLSPGKGKKDLYS